MTIVSVGLRTPGTGHGSQELVVTGIVLLVCLPLFVPFWRSFMDSQWVQEGRMWIMRLRAAKD